MLVIDTETTGLEGYPKDRVLEIGIASLDERTGDVRPVYSAMVRYPGQERFFREYEEENGPIWVFGNTELSPELIAAEGKDVEAVVAEVRLILAGEEVTSYNVPFDFGRFLDHEPWRVMDVCVVPFDIMDLATEEVHRRLDEDLIPDAALRARLLMDEQWFPGKWTRAIDAYRVLCPDDPAGRNGTQSHRALDDAVQEAWVLRAIQKGDAV